MKSKAIALEAYEKLADHYAALVDTKPHNAYYDRPAMIALWPDFQGKRVLDAGCGPGVYTELLIRRGAIVTGVDISARMLALAQKRLGREADLRLVDLNQSLDGFKDGEFDFIHAALCLDYIEDWKSLFSEFHRILRPGGQFQFSCGHPAFDAEYFRTKNYFSVERVTCVWKGFGIRVVMPSFRRSLQGVLSPLIENGFVLKQILEPIPTIEFQEADPRGFDSLMHRPSFLCIQATKPGSEAVEF